MKRHVFVMFIFACLLTGCGGGGSGDTAAIRGCLAVKVDVCGRDIKGTVTNNCGRTVGYAKVDSTGYTSGGKVVDRDPEYVEGIAPGAHAYYESPLDDSAGTISRCTSEITEAGY